MTSAIGVHPLELRFKPGQSGNPKGRPQGSVNARRAVERTLNKKISVRQGKKTRKVPMIEAVAETHALKAVQGDHRSANVLISLGSRVGAISADNDESAINGRPVAVDRRPPSAALLERINPDLLAKDEKIELARLAERIDRGGDVMVLSTSDFARLKAIQNKGRGLQEDVAPEPDASSAEAA